MSFQRVSPSKSQSPQSSSSLSQFASRPFSEPKRSPTQNDIENEAFQEHRFEALRLQLKEKYGTITPVEQERLGVLQAKMDSIWAQRRERAKKQPNLLEILTRNAQSTQASEPATPVQPKLTVGQPKDQQPDDQYEQDADRVAAQGMSMAPPATPNLQRQPEEEQNELQTKPLVETLMPIVQRQEVEESQEEMEGIQTKPLLDSITPVVQRQGEEGEDLQRAIAPIQEESPETEVQAKCATCEQEEQEQRVLRKASLTPDAIARTEQASAQPSESAVRVQPQLTIGQPGDRYEQEADRVAAQVMAMPEPASPPPVQRQETEEGQEETEEIQAKPLVDSITPLVQRQSEVEEEEIQRAIAPVESESPEADIQAKCEACEQEEQVQRTANGTMQAQPDLESRLNASKGGGSPLPDEVRSFMEPRFGADLSQVRVHTGSEAVQMNKAVRAQAFTHGKDVYFGAGKSPGINDLTAHELTHTIQQTGAKRLTLQRKEKPNKSSQPKLQEEPLNQGEPDQARVDSKVTPDTQHPSPSQANTGELTTQKTGISDPAPSVAANGASSTSQLVATPTTTRSGLPGQPEGATGATPAQTPITSNQGLPAPLSNKQTAAISGAVTQPEVTPHGAGGGPANQAEPRPKPSPNPAPATSANPPDQGAANLLAKAGNDLAADSSGGGSGSAAPTSSGDSGGQAAAIETDSGGGGDTGAEAVADTDPALEATANQTEGVELAAADQAEVQAATADVATAGDGGGEAAAGGGGGGGGAAIPDKPAPPVPDVSNAEPTQTMATIAQLPPAQLQAGLSGVGAAVGTAVSQQRAELAANPPQMERPSGSPVTKEGTAGEVTPANDKSPKPVEKTEAGAAKPVPPPQPVTLPPPPPIAASTPTVKGDTDGKVSANDAQALQSSIRQMPARDPGLNVKAEAPPPLELKGDADPKQAQEQKAKLEKSLADTHSQGQQELAQPMGEQEIYPKVPKETLKAEVGGSAAGGGAIASPAMAGGAGKGAEGDDAISIIAQQEHGAEIQTAVAQAQAQMTAQKQDHVVKVAEEKEKSNKEISKLQADNSNEQAQERAKAQAEVSKQRADWNKEQTALVDKCRKDADSKIAKGMEDVQKEQTQAETKAAEHIKKGNQDAERARLKGEQDAAAEKQKAEKDSGGIFGWLADKAKAFFDGIKQAIQKAFELARAAVKAAIDLAKKLATEVIEAARKAIVAVIKTVGEALIAIGDVMLAAFPEMRDRFRNAIKATVQKAEATVNALAEKLKQGVQAALNLLGKGLDAALGLLEKGYLLAVDIASKAVQGAISAAKAAIDVLGAFALLIKDIAAAPGQWLSNLAAGVMDGIRNHLWTAFQTAVKEWFNQKVEEVLGLGLTIWNVLKKGGINLAEVGKMAWEGIKAAIPPALIQILIEKLVAMIIPAAGAVMAIVEGLQAAWGTVSRILQAMERFMGFLKAVKTGQSGPQFGQLLAAAGIILIDFVANWLLKRVRGAASKVAGKIKAIAQKIGDKLKKTMKKLGKKLHGGMKKLGDKAKKLKEKIFGGKDKKKNNEKQPDKQKKEDKDRKNQEKLNKAVAAIKPQAEQLLKGGTSKLYLRGKLLYWQVRYGLTSLTLSGNGVIKAKVNPEEDITKIKDADLGKELLQVFAEAEQAYEKQLLSNPDRKRKVDEARIKWAAREPQSLAGLSRYEQSMVIRDTPVPRLSSNDAAQAAKKGSQEVEPDVRVWWPAQGGSRGMVQNIHKYDALFKNITQKAKGYGLSDQEIASIIFGNADRQEEKLSVLAMRMRQQAQREGKISKKAANSIDIFSRQLKRTALLVQSFESSRSPGIATTTAVSSAMVMSGHASLEDVLSSEGKMAPMTPEGAAPESGKATTEEQKVAEEKRNERVGHIFKRLLSTAKKQKVVVTEGGYDLSNLVAAIEAWLSQKVKQDPQALAASETLLQAELIKLISSSHRKL